MALAYEPRTELYRFHFGVVLATVLLATLLQVYLPPYLPFDIPLDLPLLVVIYFGFSRRNPTTGLLLGLAVGILQDALIYEPIQHPSGRFGMAKTVLGFAASSLSSRVDTDHARARLLLVFVFYHLHQFIYAGSQRLLLDQPAQFISLAGLEAALVNSLLGMLAFHFLDKFRRTL